MRCNEQVDSAGESQTPLEPDMYSTGLVYGFGNASQFVLCLMHSLLLNTLPRLWSIISPSRKKKQRPLYSREVDQCITTWQNEAVNDSECID